jgi:hypothetical protein
MDRASLVMPIGNRHIPGPGVYQRCRNQCPCPHKTGQSNNLHLRAGSGQGAIKLTTGGRREETVGSHHNHAVVCSLGGSVRGGPAVGPLLERLVDLLRAEGLPAAVTLQIEASADLPRVEVDPDKLHQVLLNLARNALQAVGPRGAIRLRAQLTERDGPRRHAVVGGGCAFGAVSDDDDAEREACLGRINRV